MSRLVDYLENTAAAGKLPVLIPDDAGIKAFAIEMDEKFHRAAYSSSPCFRGFVAIQGCRQCKDEL